MIRSAMDAAQADDAPSSRGRDGIPQLCHELRQPLVVAVGYVSMLDDGAFGEMPAESKRILAIVAERLDAMNAIIDRLANEASPTG